MRLLLDSAQIDQARQAAAWGWVSGATTNPSLLAASSLPPAQTLRELGRIFNDGLVFYQLTGRSIEEMSAEAGLAKDLLGRALVLKIPATALGFQAAAALSREYTVAVTSLFTVGQALAAHAAGARYALYYHNRAKRLLPDGAELAARLTLALAGTDTLVAAASLKSAQEVAEARLAGAAILSAPFQVLKQLTEDEHSISALKEFRASGIGLLDRPRSET